MRKYETSIGRRSIGGRTCDFRTVNVLSMPSVTFGKMVSGPL